jgi:hypothetical protein
MRAIQLLRENACLGGLMLSHVSKFHGARERETDKNTYFKRENFEKENNMKIAWAQARVEACIHSF